MQNATTPMMRQYQEIKKKYPDCLLFYRMGDFYELFMEDAHIGSKILNITLTGKSNGKNGRIPMAGVPYHAADAYVSKLVKAGYKVAICEQLSPPNKKGLVARDVVRIVTPGTVVDAQMLDKKENNYIVSIEYVDSRIAFSYADISTGYFGTYEMATDTIAVTLSEELSKLAPVECILSDALYNDSEFLKSLKEAYPLNIYRFADWEKYADNAKDFLKKYFAVATLESFGITDETIALQSAAALIGYLQYTQKTTVAHIKKISVIAKDEYMHIDRSSMLNLELFTTLRDHAAKRSLLGVLDQTATPMGARLLRQWMRKPLISKESIDARLDAVSEISHAHDFREGVSHLLDKIPDVERTLSRLSVHIGNARDLIHLKNALVTILAIKEALSGGQSHLLADLEKEIEASLSTVVQTIESHIVDAPPIDIKSGGMIKKGVNTELDQLHTIVTGSRDWMIDLEHSERARTKIASLKVKYNKVFGFYIEVSKSNLHLVPEDYIRKQTLVNGERFVTPELKHHEEIILSAQEKIIELEYDMFQKILSTVLSYTQSIQNAAESIAILDCLVNFSKISLMYEYVRPKIVFSGEMRIIGGRHPVIERVLDQGQFVANDLHLDTTSQQLLLITGPNMAGKSVFIRQVAIISLMAQMGCFVPAKSAHISVVDRIFVRSGASDMITSGLSTFMVEMVETAHILNNATKDSLIIMDEIGRGTSTYDGISIAWAVAEYLVTQFKISPKTLFATHYHELQELEEKFPKKIRNFHMAVTSEQGTPIFLHTILPGGASHSFGVAVAKLAGIPDIVIKNAESMLQSLEKRDMNNDLKNKTDISVDPRDIGDRLIHKELESIDISSMTPLEALNTLATLKEKLKMVNDQKRKLHVD